MKLYSENKSYKLYNGNMLDMLEVIEHESIDSIVTDPPYELNFMNKGWDNAGVSFNKNTWEKCFEVLKPGGYLLAFGGSRTYHRIACAIEDAGFEIRDTIMWIYGSGFPKSMAIDKAVDKRNASGFEVRSELALHIRESLKSKNLTKLDLLARFNNSTKVNHWISTDAGNFYQPSKLDYQILVDEFGCSWDYFVVEAERDVIGVKKNCLNNWGNKNNIIDRDITLPSTDLAKQWQGWGTSLKPAFEPIIVARKPFKGSCVDNVLKYGVGGINIDECRVEFKNGETNGSILRYNSKPQIGNNGWEHKNRGALYNEDTRKSMEKGRFPANVILTYDETDFEEVCGGFPNTKNGVAVRHNSGGKTFGGENKKPPMDDLGYNDSGSAARYFYCAKASKKIEMKD